MAAILYRLLDSIFQVTYDRGIFNLQQSMFGWERVIFRASRSSQIIYSYCYRILTTIINIYFVFFFVQTKNNNYVSSKVCYLRYNKIWKVSHISVYYSGFTCTNVRSKVLAWLP